MNITLAPFRDAASTKNIFFPLFEKQPLSKEVLFLSLPAHTRKTLERFTRSEFSGKKKQIKTLWLPTGRTQRIILMGLGDKKKWNKRTAGLLARMIVRHCISEHLDECSVALPASIAPTPEAERFAINAHMASYAFNAYKNRKQRAAQKHIKKIVIAADKHTIAEARHGARTGAVIGEEVNACRRLANTPGGDMTPKTLAQEAQEIGKKTPMHVRVLGKQALERMGMGGILGVARGSEEEPQYILMEYRGGPKNQKPLALVGKGVTFDTGGLNLKPAQAINEMHMDMSGGAAVIHGMSAIARLKLPINALGIVPAVENMPSGSSYRPGDLLKTMSGKTIEVLNTDAEGRVILSDALYHATQHKPGFILDLATLTGAAHVAVGNFCSALFTNRDELQEILSHIGTVSGDYVWPLPLWDEYLEEIIGTFGDLANDATGGNRYGGAIHAAKFLEQFVENIPWAHIDIAPRMTAHNQEYLTPGAAGTGVRYIVELARHYPSLIEQLV